MHHATATSWPCALLLRRRRPDRAGRLRCSRRADVARLGPLQFAARPRPHARSCREQAASIRPRSSQLCGASGASRCSRHRPWSGAWWLRQPSVPRTPGLKTIVYGGGPMYRGGHHSAREVMGQRSPRSTARARARWRSPRCRRAIRRSAASALQASAWHPSASRKPRRGAGRRWDDRPLPAGEIGEVLVRGERDGGLLAQPEATARRCATAGCIPATSAASTQTVSSRSRIAPRT